MVKVQRKNTRRSGIWNRKSTGGGRTSSRAKTNSKNGNPEPIAIAWLETATI